jgi:hypothetical protein
MGMQINPVGNGPSPEALQTRKGLGSASDEAGTARTGEARAAGASASTSVSGSSLAISATQTSISQSVSSLITSFAPFSADQDLMKLLLLLIALEIINGGGDKDQQSAGGALFLFQSESTSSFQSLEVSYSETSVSYGLDAYSAQSQIVTETSAGNSSGDAPSGGETGRNLDLQA